MSIRWRHAALALLLGLAGATGPSVTAQDETVWQPCPPESGAAGAECTSLALPARAEDPDAGVIDVAVGRMLRQGTSAEPRTQVWYLAGGPGDSGIEALPRLAEVFADVSADLYAIDHRGVGGTAVLRCPEQEAEDSVDGREIVVSEWAACIEWLRTHRDDLEILTTERSAGDLAAAIDAFRGDSRVVVFGASYGTYWANEYLRVRPDQADAVILDGIVPPDWTFAEFDASLDATGTALVQRCIRSAECAEHLGPDPVTLLRELPGRIAEGHCEGLGLDAHTLRLVLGNMLMAGAEIRPYIPAVVFRLDRCRIRDMEAIGALFENLFESGDAGSEPASHSPALQRHVAMSEMWPAEADPEALEAALQNTAMTTAVSANFAKTYADWPRYPEPDGANSLAAWEGPMLLLHGGLDPTMPVERLDSLRAHFSGPSQHFVLLPDAGHVVINEGACPRSIYRQFITDPASPPDVSCVDEMPPVDLTAPEGDTTLFGTTDFWGESASTLEIGMTVVSILIGIGIAVVTVWVVRWTRRKLTSGREA